LKICLKVIAYNHKHTLGGLYDFPSALSVSDSPGWRTGNRIKISHSTRADSFSYYAEHHNGIALLDILPLVIPSSRLPLLLFHLARFARSCLAAANETAREQRRSNRATNVFTLSLPSTTKRDYLNASTGPTKSRCTLVTVYMAVGSVNCAYETLISRGQDVTGCALTTLYTGCSVKSNFANLMCVVDSHCLRINTYKSIVKVIVKNGRMNFKE